MMKMCTVAGTMIIKQRWGGMREMRKLDFWVIKARIRCRQAAELLKKDDGIGTVEMILILVVLIGLVLIFKEKLSTLVDDIFKTINSKSKSV